MDLRKLYAEFPRSAIHWRAQSVSENTEKALALAYLDARDVMDRLDDVVGPQNWQDSYVETPSGRVICTLSIKVDGMWVDKADGSGSTDIEGEKGGISGAFKRAAVKWGIGRYLYDMPNVWVPCELRQQGNKKVWKAWKVDPWTCVRNAPIAHIPEGGNPEFADAPPPVDAPKSQDAATSIGMSLDGAQGEEALVSVAAECLRQWGEPANWPGTIKQKYTQAIERLGADGKKVGQRARIINAAEQGAAA